MSIQFNSRAIKKRDELMAEVHGMKKPEHKYTCDICQIEKSVRVEIL